LDFVNADNKNAIETPFFTISSPQKGMGGTPIGFWEKSNFFSSVSLDLGIVIVIPDLVTTGGNCVKRPPYG